jgi:hypothetical protein
MHVASLRDDSGVLDLRVGEQECFQFSRRDLKALELDDLLHSVNDEHLLVLVDERNVSCVQVAVFVYGVGCRFRIVQVT